MGRWLTRALGHDALTLKRGLRIAWVTRGVGVTLVIIG